MDEIQKGQLLLVPAMRMKSSFLCAVRLCYCFHALTVYEIAQDARTRSRSPAWGVPGGAASGDGEGGASLLRESGESQSPRSSCSIGFEQYEGSQNTRNEGTHGLIDIRN